MGFDRIVNFGLRMMRCAGPLILGVAASILILGCAAGEPEEEPAVITEPEQIHLADVIEPLDDEEAASYDTIERHVIPIEKIMEEVRTEDEIDPSVDDIEIITIGKPRTDKKSEEDSEESSEEETVIFDRGIFGQEAFGRDGSVAEYGIDVSKFNKEIDWESVKAAGIDFAIIRCAYRGGSSGYLVMDPYWERNYEGARAAGIKVGTYFFTQAVTEEEAVEEASLTCALIASAGVDYPVFVDSEAMGGRADFLDTGERTRILSAFVETVRSAGYESGVYANKNWFTHRIDTDALPSGTCIWLAQYGVEKPSYKGNYDIWQYSSKGSVPGIAGNVDLDRSYIGR